MPIGQFFSEVTVPVKQTQWPSGEQLHFRKIWEVGEDKEQQSSDKALESVEVTAQPITSVPKAITFPNALHICSPLYRCCAQYV